MKKRYAEVIVDISSEKLDHPFTYRIPDALSERVVPGSRVRIPFGNGGRVIDGYAVGISDDPGLDESKIKDIADVLTGEETAESRLVLLAAWMSRNYGSTTIQALKTVVPMKKSYEPQLAKTVSISDGDQAERYLDICRKKNWKARARAVETLLRSGPLSAKELQETAEVPSSVIRELAAAEIVSVSSKQLVRGMLKEAAVFPADDLTKEQMDAACAVWNEWKGQNRPVLLNGVTGSGKTVVYIELAARVLEEGRQAIVLIPEIALTQQTVLRFVRRFGNRVSFLHSRLSGGERYDQMKAAKEGKISVMVGPRSALFTPFPNLGLIIIDEEHEETYRSEITPRYHARETAVERARIEGAHVLLGSATPSLTSSYRVKQGEYFGVGLSSRYGDSVLPDTEIVDLREELKEGNRSMISRLLRERIDQTLSRGNQVMLFLNRRGHTGFITCRSCGYVIRCPHCDVSLTRHRNGRLVCHYCGYERPDVKKCPSCGSPYIGGFTAGTEQAEEALGDLFPGAGILRMDADTTKGREGHEKILGGFAAGKADILVGTQMIVKGHDFPNVTLVGMLLADLSLSDSSYRSGERTYQLIAQAVGRAGRGSIRGRAVIQTYHPSHYAVLAGARQDYESFYREEMVYRDLLGYPPRGTMAAILGSSKDEDRLSTAMHFIRKYIDRIDPEGLLQAVGPAPESVGKVRDNYRQAIYIRNASRENVIRAKDRIETYIAVNRGFDGIRISMDFNV